MGRVEVETALQEPGLEPGAPPERGRAEGRRSGGWELARGIFFWAFGILLLAAPVVALPAQGRWLAVKTFALEVGGILLAVWAVSRGEWSRERVREALLAAPNLAILLFLLWIGISVGRAELAADARYEAMRHVGGALVYFGVLYGISLRRQLHGFVGLLVVAAAVAAIFAFLTATETDVRRLAGAFRNEQLLAGFLCLMFPVALMASIGEETEWRRIGGQIAVVIVGAALLLARNRSAWFGTLAAAALLVLLHLWRPPQGERLRLQKHQMIIPALMVLLSVGLFIAMSRSGGVLAQRAGTLVALREDVSFRWRQGMWDKTLRMIRDRPLFGWGVGAYPLQQALYYHPDAPPRSQREIAVLGAGLLENAHNTYLQLAAELGIPGLALYLGILGAFFATGLRALGRMKRGFRRAVLLGAMAGIAAQIVSGIGSPAWEFAECSLFFWAVLGLGMLAAGVGDRGRTMPEAGKRP